MQNPTMFTDLESNVGASSAEDERTLQIALELSNLGLLGNCDDESFYDEVARGKKSQNMTECVPVPSSEHVAEIVGRQGCKIKALRAKTNTYIKTPVRGEEPVFVVTGRKEDVAMARREVQSAAEHFTQIRASRNRHALLASQAFGSLNGDGTAGTITLQVRVPYRVVGLVVGPKGATIKRIQQQTHTYIVTPSREKEPVFEVTGLPENVEKAKEEIEAHIALRTCAQQTSIDDDFKNNGTEVGSPCNTAEFVKPVYNPQSSTSTFAPSSVSNSVLRSAAPNFFPMSAQTLPPTNIPSQPAMIVPSSFDVLGYAERPYNGSNLSGNYVQDNQKFNGSWNLPINGHGDISTTLPSFLSNLSAASLSNSSVNSGLSQQRLSPTLSEPEFANFSPILMPATSAVHLPVRRVESEDSTTSSVPSIDVGNLLSPTGTYISTPAVNIESGYSSSGTADSMSGSPDAASLSLDNLQVKTQQRCIVCCDNLVSAALVPCGHHLFCFTCAKEIVGKSPPQCPCCRQNAVRPLLIKQ